VNYISRLQFGVNEEVSERKISPRITPIQPNLSPQRHRVTEKTKTKNGLPSPDCPITRWFQAVILSEAAWPSRRTPRMSETRDTASEHFHDDNLSPRPLRFAFVILVNPRDPRWAFGKLREPAAPW